ncbi:MAG: AMIN domain-containing protein [Terriglobales bacterium]|jgi:hypothetical protein
MKFLSRISYGVLAVAAALAPVLLLAQSSPQPVAFTAKVRPKAQTSAAIVLMVRVVPDKNGPAVEIISTRPLLPELQKLDNPPRLVIDLPNTNNSLQQKQVDFHLGAFRTDPVRAVRVDQFQNRPPITRVVIDLLKTSEYTWDLAGNLLTVRLHSDEAVAAKPASMAALTAEAQPVAIPVSSGSSGIAVSLDRFAGGSTVTAGSETQVLSLGNGGEVRVCPGTTLSVTNSSNGQDLLFGMSTGAFEAHYILQSSADSVLTPDFRIVLEGPGEFHYAIRADTRGNTCMRALPGNTASAMVSELIGDDRYEVKPGEQVFFHSGHLAAMDTAASADCGCPEPSIPVMRASADMQPASGSTDSVQLAQLGGMTPAPTNIVTNPETVPLRPADSHKTRVQIEAPLVFSASDSAASSPAAMPEAHSSPANNSSASALLPTTVQPSRSTETNKSRRGLFGKVKGFFAAIFH